MIIKDENLLNEFRGRRCEWCSGTVCGVPSEAHHLFARGMGGGGRLDIRINLIALCLYCHRALHNGNLRRRELLEFVSKRENKPMEWIVGEIHRLRRLPKDAPIETYGEVPPGGECPDHQRDEVHPGEEPGGVQADEEGWRPL